MKKKIWMVLLLAFVILLAGIGYYKVTKEQIVETDYHKILQTENGLLQAGVCRVLQVYVDSLDFMDSWTESLTPEEQSAGVYTFLQGPRAFSENLPWSGEWCQQIVGWNKFGGFGCGFCCMANIYSTLTNYECSPWDMYEYAIHVSKYYPSEESGAIGWKDMKKTMKRAGFTCKLCHKPETYEEFQAQMKQVKSMIVLVNSGDDDTFWKDTGGHYVNIWLYQEDSDTVFLAEPGDPENNRTWIPLRYVYDALKTVSQYQYLAVNSYTEEKNDWKYDGIDDNWNGKF